MGRFFLYAIFLMIVKFGIIEAAEPQILIRDRLLMVLCEQVEEYMQNGTFPEPMKIIPDKHKIFRAGVERSQSGTGRMASMDNSMSAMSGRTASKFGQKAGRSSTNDLKYGYKTNRNKRELTTLQQDFEDCSKPGANCVLDLWEN